MIIDPYKFTASSAVQVSLVHSGFYGAATTVSFGEEAADRELVAVVRFYRSPDSSVSLTSATIGGVSANIRLQRSDRPFNAPVVRGVAFVAANVPSGVTGLLNFAFSAAADATVRLYRVTGLNSRTPVATASAGSASAVASTTIEVDQGGIVLVSATVKTNAGDGTSTGFPVGYSAYEISTVNHVQGGVYLGTSDEAAHAISATTPGPSGGKTNTQIAAVSYR